LGESKIYYTCFNRQKQGVLNSFFEKLEKNTMKNFPWSKRMGRLKEKHDCQRNILMEKVQLKSPLA
jgi:hypothetical protein